MTDSNEKYVLWQLGIAAGSDRAEDPAIDYGSDKPALAFHAATIERLIAKGVLRRDGDRIAAQKSRS